MQAAIITVGDELLAGDVVNTNASWLAEQLSERGVTVREIVTIPDETDLIAERVRRMSDAFDAVIVTGGIGGTPDDVTMDGVAAAFGEELAVNDEALEEVMETVDAYDRDDIDVDVEAWSAMPVGARPISNPEGLSPGCVIENVFVFPGIPNEMKPMFELVAEEFAGNLHARTAYTDIPESNLVPVLERAHAEFDVAVGSYPNPDGGEKRIKVTGEDEAAVSEVYDWLTEQIELIDADR